MTTKFYPTRLDFSPAVFPAVGVGTPARRAEAGFSGAALPPLGTSAKYVAADPETGEIAGFDPMGFRAERFALQEVARSILSTSRIAKCLRIRAHGQQAQVWRSREFGTTSYGGLQTCGSVWACPVCAAKIAERRRAEVVAAMTAHKAAGGCVNMLTLTTPHQRGDDLAELLASQAKAVKAFWADWTVKAVLEEMGTVGQIRALEVTNGRRSVSNNGWHPHYHVLVFGGVGVDLVRFSHNQMQVWSDRLYERWAAKCLAAGLGLPSRAHGLKLHDGSQAAAYASKWGLEHEMTKGHTKKAKQGSETPFDLLRAVLADPDDAQAAALFKEFADVFKGKRQLHWSKGLKARFAIEETSDEELAERLEEDAELVGVMTLEQWRDVLAVKGRAVVLCSAASGGWPAVSAYLGTIKGASFRRLEKLSGRDFRPSPS